LLLAGCGPHDNDPGPGGATVGEARALDEAAAMLEERQGIAPHERDGEDGADQSASNAGSGESTE
jgi:hypothetical protein